MIRKREAGVGFGSGNRWREDVGGEGAGGLGADGRIFDAIAHDESSGGEIAEALVVAGDEDGDDADRVEERNLVNVADEVARHGLEEADGAAGALDDADAGDALAGGAAVPEGLKQGEVAPVEQKDQEDVESGCPLRGQRLKAVRLGRKKAKIQIKSRIPVTQIT